MLVALGSCSQAVRLGLRQGLLLLGGPLAESPHGRFCALLIVNADSEAEIQHRLADDPWAATEQIVTVSIELWTVLVGAERLSSASTAQTYVVERRAAR